MLFCKIGDQLVRSLLGFTILGLVSFFILGRPAPRVLKPGGLCEQCLGAGFEKRAQPASRRRRRFPMGGCTGSYKELVLSPSGRERRPGNWRWKGVSPPPPGGEHVPDRTGIYQSVLFTREGRDKAEHAGSPNPTASHPPSFPRKILTQMKIVLGNPPHDFPQPRSARACASINCPGGLPAEDCCTTLRRTILPAQVS